MTDATGLLDATGATGALVTSDGTGPDFSGCVGLKGLDNAICRHEVLLAGDPTNPGLLNSLAHLQANAAKHLIDATDTTSVDGSSISDTSCPGHSCDPHGQSGEPHGNSDGSQGNGNGND